MVDDNGPFGAAAQQYWSLGWREVLPLPPGQKWPPPPGWTGHDGAEPSWADLQAWLDGAERHGNIALRLPRGVLGLDVDAYGDKRGAATLAELAEQFGPLPDTWMSSARDDGVSGIRLYRLPAEFAELEGPGAVHWPGEAGPNIEIIQYGHRYAVVWPSINPHADGAEYGWVWPGGTRIRTAFDPIPRRDELAELPLTWAQGLARAGERRHGAELDDDASRSWLDKCRASPACDIVLRTAQTAAAELAARASARHEVMRDAVHALARMGGEGHAGAADALGWLRPRFIEAVSDDRSEQTAAGEWLRALAGAVRLAAGTDREPRQACGCDVWAGRGLEFDPGPFGSAEAGQSEAPQRDPAYPDGDHRLTTVDSEAAGQPVDLVELLLSRMLDRDALDKIPAPRPLIRDVLDLESESWLIGAPGCFKSFVALDWACHIVTGLHWRGKHVHRGPVVYVAAEGRKSIQLRVSAWESEYSVRADGLIVLPQPVQVSNEAGWAALVEACRRLEPVMVVIDTQARITVGLDENNNGAMGQLVDGIRRLKEATGACVLVVHHTGRDGRDARGASAVDGAQDTEIRVDRPRVKAERDALWATISMDKQKDGDESHVFDIQLKKIELGESEDGRPLSSLALARWDPFGPPRSRRPEPDWVANLTENQADVLAAFRAHGDANGATGAEARRWINERRSRDERPAMPETSFASAVKSLVEGTAERPPLVERMGVSRLVLIEHKSEGTGVSDMLGMD